MLRVLTVTVALLVMTASASPGGLQSQGGAPTARVENLRATQGGSGIVQLTYDLMTDDPAATFDVSLEVSTDRGATWTVKARSVTGSVGANVSPGVAKGVVWDSGKDIETMQFDQLRFRIVPVGRVRASSAASNAPRSPVSVTSAPKASPSPSGGGSRKWLYVGGAGGAAAAAALLASGKTSENSSSSQPGVAFSIVSSTPGVGGTIIVPPGMSSQQGWGDVQPNLRLTMQFTAPPGSRDDSWTLQLLRGGTVCLATQGGYATRQGATPAASGATTVTFVNFFWVLQACGTTFSTDSLRFTFTGAPTTVDQTVNVGWTFHP